MASYSTDLLNKVWEKGNVVAGKNPNLYRQDRYGNIIFKSSYGKQTPMGWEIDHLKPVSKGGTDHLNNLAPTYWHKNRQKGNKYPYKS
ncbi:MAG: HNH endonuclease signature motif containing protein [Spirosomataceae bacterium]